MANDNDSDISNLLASMNRPTVYGGLTTGLPGTNMETRALLRAPSPVMGMSPNIMTAPGNPNTPAPGGVSASDMFMGGAGSNSPIQPRLASVQQNPNNPMMKQFQQLLQQLLGSFTQQNTNQQ